MNRVEVAQAELAEAVNGAQPGATDAAASLSRLQAELVAVRADLAETLGRAQAAESAVAASEAMAAQRVAADTQRSTSMENALLQLEEERLQAVMRWENECERTAHLEEQLALLLRRDPRPACLSTGEIVQPDVMKTVQVKWCSLRWFLPVNIL